MHQRPAVTTATLTPIAVPHNVTKLVFSGCVVWARSGANNGGIAKIDLATNQVLDTIVPAEIVGDLDDQIRRWHPRRYEPSEQRPQYIDSPNPGQHATDAVTTLLNLPVNGDFVVLDGQVWNRKFRFHRSLSELWLVPLDGSKPAVQSGTIPTFIGAAFGSVWTESVDGKAVERWDTPGLAPTASIDVGTDSQCLIADHGIDACVSPSGRVALSLGQYEHHRVERPEWPTGPATWSTWRRRAGSIWLQPAATQPGRTDAHELIAARRSLRHNPAPRGAGGPPAAQPLGRRRQPVELSGAGQPLARLDLPPR